MPFVGRIALSPIDQTRWLLLSPVDYVGRTDAWTIPAGFPTDLASVPACMVWAVSRYGAHLPAALLHDYLCREVRLGRFNQRDADGILRRVLGELGVPGPLRWAMWAAVRAGSRLTGATRKEAAQVLGIGLCASPLLLFSLLLVWPAQRVVRLVERI